MHRVLVELGGTPQVWRTDRMATIVIPGTDRLTVDAAQAAKHYGVEIAVCPPRRAQRKGVVEAAIKYTTVLGGAARRSPRWPRRSARWIAGASRSPTSAARPAATVGELGAAEPLRALPAAAYPALIAVERKASRSALVAFEGNRYSVAPGYAARTLDRPRPRRRAVAADPLGGGRAGRDASPRPGGRRPDDPQPRARRRCSSTRSWPRSPPTTPARARPTARPARTRSPSSRA